MIGLSSAASKFTPFSALQYYYSIVLLINSTYPHFSPLMSLPPRTPLGDNNNNPGFLFLFYLPKLKGGIAPCVSSAVRRRADRSGWCYAGVVSLSYAKLFIITCLSGFVIPQINPVTAFFNSLIGLDCLNSVFVPPREFIRKQ